jgi:hypothetical protein
MMCITVCKEVQSQRRRTNYVLNCTPNTQRKLETGMTVYSSLLLCFCRFLHRIYQSIVYSLSKLVAFANILHRVQQDCDHRQLVQFCHRLLACFLS